MIGDFAQLRRVVAAKLDLELRHNLSQRLKCGHQPHVVENQAVQAGDCCSCLVVTQHRQVPGCLYLSERISHRGVCGLNTTQAHVCRRQVKRQRRQGLGDAVMKVSGDPPTLGLLGRDRLGDERIPL